MKSMISFTVSSLLLAAVSALAQAPTPSLVLNAITSEGCFSSSDPMQDQGSYMYQSSGYCQQTCVGLGKAVMGTTSGSNCWCGDELPAANSKVSDDKCNTPCNGYNKANCMSTHPTQVDLSSGSETSMLTLCHRRWSKHMVGWIDRHKEQCSERRRLEFEHFIHLTPLADIHNDSESHEE